MVWGPQRENYPSRTPNNNDEAETKVIFLGLPRVTGTFTSATEKVAKNKLSHKLQKMENPAPHQSFYFPFSLLPRDFCLQDYLLFNIWGKKSFQIFGGI